MGENSELKWERIRTGERIELGLVQVDIVGHSKIPAGDLTLKKAKDIFSDEIRRIAIALGGKLFAWAGDGGSFMFLMGDGEGFNTLVSAALEMLDSMPAINQQIADKTDLKKPLRVRLSCDAGTVVFDQDSTLITADFINRFTKYERAISIADTICITERVYNQLDSQLRSRFSFYKPSPEVRGDIYSLTRHRLPLRWKHAVLAGLTGIVLGLFCAAVLAHFGWWVKPPEREIYRSNTVYMVGSGTVYRYLIASHLFDKLAKDKRDVQVLEGPTETGAWLFAGTSQPSTVLVMSSEKLDISKLRQYEGQPGAVFEVYLGADTLQMLFAAGGKRSSAPSDLDNYFLKSEKLKFASIVEVWANGQYDVYVGAEKSATKELWAAYLKGRNKEIVWPPNIKTWDIRTDQILEWTSDGNPRIYLGSEMLNEDLIAKLKKKGILYHPLTMIDDSSLNPVKRGLYLYGWVNKQKVTHGEDTGYDLPKPITDILKYVFDSIRDRRSSIDGALILNEKCREDQIKYFNLKTQGEEGEGWISIYPPPVDNIYRVKACDGRPEK